MKQDIKIRDITEEWELACSNVCKATPTDCPADYIGWKDIRSEGCKYVVISGVVYEYNKYGLGDIVGKIDNQETK